MEQQKDIVYNIPPYIKSIFKSTTEAFFIYFENDQKTRWYGNFQSLTGLDNQEINSFSWDNFLERVHPDDRKNVIDAKNRAREVVQSYEISYRYSNRDNSYIYVLEKGTYYNDASKGIILSGTFTDISSQKNIETTYNKKRFSQNIINRIFDIAHKSDTIEELFVESFKVINEYTQCPLAHAIILPDVNHKIKISSSIYYSPVPEKYLDIIQLFEQKIETYLTPLHLNVLNEKKIKWIVNPEKEKDYKYGKILSQANMNHLILVPIVVSDKSIGLLEFFAEQLYVSEEYVYDLYQQIEKQLGIIIELKISSEELNKSFMAIEQNYASIIITDANGIIEYVNPAFCEISGYSFDELIGKKPSVIKSGIHTGEFYKELWDTISSGNRWQGEICNKKKDGSIFWEQVNISPVKNARNEIINYVGVKIDITKKRQYEEELRKAKEEAEVANRSKSEFLANMSHEIRTPMNAIMGFTDVLSQKITDEQAKSYLESIKSSGRNLLTLINDVLDLSKIEAGKMKIDREFIDPFFVFKDIEYLFSLKAQEKGLEFKIITDLNLPMGIEIDEVRLRQILINLIGNAIKFTEKGSVIVNITAFPTSTEYIDLKMEVKDTGIGIAPEHLETIFEPFTQLENAATKRYSGTGLGLTITKRLIDILGGEITVNSEINKGTTFTVLFRKVPATSQKQQNIEMVNIDPKKIKFNPALVILADDVDNNRKYLKTVMQDTDIEVIESTNGLETYELARAHRPQLIITDLKMPGINGFELLGKLRTDPLTRNIPVIATTATASIEEHEKLKVHQFEGILIKPIQINDVYIELMRFLPHEIIDSDEEKGKGDDISIIAQSDMELRTVKSILENELMEIWKTFEDQQPISEVENFAFKLRDLGKKYNLEILVSYGNRLMTAVNNFDIDLILKILADYPKLLSTFKVVSEE
jgi:PAS domain S-box-containing protein